VFHTLPHPFAFARSLIFSANRIAAATGR
jgi:hypothetical protein